MADVDWGGPEADPDEVLLRNVDLVRDAVTMHTVPLFFFRGEVQPGNRVGAGTGVLVRLGGRYFILTAGHCVEEAGDGPVVVGITNHAHRFVPQLVRRSYRYEPETERDFGYFEVPAVDAGTIRAQDRVFLAEADLEVLDAASCRARDDWMVVAGYPHALEVGEPQARPGTRLLAYATTLAGSGEAPASTLHRQHADHQVADLWVPAGGNLEGGEQVAHPIDVPSLSGASGGGCWLAGVRPNPDGWTTDRLRLMGTHSGSCAAVEIDGEEHVFAREILLGHHLNLIAAEYDDLRAALLAGWPAIAGFPV